MPFSLPYPFPDEKEKESSLEEAPGNTNGKNEAKPISPVDGS